MLSDEVIILGKPGNRDPVGLDTSMVGNDHLGDPSWIIHGKCIRGHRDAYASRLAMIAVDFTCNRLRLDMGG